MEISKTINFSNWKTEKKPGYFLELSSSTPKHANRMIKKQQQKIDLFFIINLYLNHGSYA